MKPNDESIALTFLGKKLPLVLLHPHRFYHRLPRSQLAPSEQRLGQHLSQGLRKPVAQGHAISSQPFVRLVPWPFLGQGAFRQC